MKKYYYFLTPLSIFVFVLFLSSIFSNVYSQTFEGGLGTSCTQVDPDCRTQCPASCGERVSGVFCSVGNECGVVEYNCHKVPIGWKCVEEICLVKVLGVCREKACTKFERVYERRCASYNLNYVSTWKWCCSYCNPGDCGTKPPCNASSWSDTSSCSVSCGGGTKTQVNDCGSTRTVACNTQSCSINVEGYIWDATDKSCNASKSANEITAADVTGSITPTIDGTTGTWDTGFSGKNYEITGVATGNNKVLSANPDATGDLFRYTLKCLNDSTSGVIGGSALIDVNSDTTAHLGYELTSSGWFQAINAGIYAGGNAIHSVSVGLPSAPVTDFTNYLIDGPGSLITNTLFSVKDADDNDRVVDNSGLSADENRYTYESLGESAELWPDYFSFDPPNDVADIDEGDLQNNLEAGKDYNLGSGSVTLSGDYTVGGDGIAIVYTSGSITFDGNYRSTNDNRILFVVNNSVTVESGVGEAAPNLSTEPHIQVGLIAKGSIDFESVGDETDTTVIVESPIVAKDGSIVFGRNRGDDNGYPGTVVKFNPVYLNKAGGSSVSLIDVLWQLE